MFNFVASGARMQLPLAIPLRMLGSQAPKQPVTASKATTVPSGRARTVVNSSPLVSRVPSPALSLTCLHWCLCMYVCMHVCCTFPSLATTILHTPLYHLYKTA